MIAHHRIYITPMGKPRMTRRDKWAKRACVVRYRAFSDELRSRVGSVPQDALRVDFVAFVAMPKSWSKKRKDEMRGQYHRQKPDVDNIAKAVFDSLFDDDSGIADSHMVKRWDDGNGARIELTIETEQKGTE